MSGYSDSWIELRTAEVIRALAMDAGNSEPLYATWVPITRIPWAGGALVVGASVAWDPEPAPELWVYPAMHRGGDGKPRVHAFQRWPHAERRLQGHVNAVMASSSPLRTAVNDYPWVIASTPFLESLGHLSAQAAWAELSEEKRGRGQPKRTLHSDAASVADAWRALGDKFGRADAAATLRDQGTPVNLRKLTHLRARRADSDIGPVVLRADPFPSSPANPSPPLPPDELIDWLRLPETLARVRLIALGTHGDPSFLDVGLKRRLRRIHTAPFSFVHYRLVRGSPSWRQWRDRRRDKLVRRDWSERAVFPPDDDPNPRPGRWHYTRRPGDIDKGDLDFEPEFTITAWTQMSEATSRAPEIAAGDARILAQREFLPPSDESPRESTG